MKESAKMVWNLMKNKNVYCIIDDSRNLMKNKNVYCIIDDSI